MPSRRRVKSLEPQLAEGIRVLVLGSMPGAVSLERQEYYAHPHNRFWRVVQKIAGVDASQPYRDRVQALLNAGVGLWDVIASCERAGSLDGAIVRGTEVPNDFQSLLRSNAGLTAIAFNGAKAFAVFDRLVAPRLRLDRVELIALPSTSPANAAWTQSRLVAAWRRLLPHIGKGGRAAQR